MNYLLFGLCFLVTNCVYYMYTKYMRSIVKKNNYTDNLEVISDTVNYTENNETNVLNGVFEIHITVDPKDNFVKLLNFVKKYEKTKGMKVVYAVSSVKNNQYMLSYFTRKADDRLAVNSALYIAEELYNDEIEVIRVKVEGHNVFGTPMTDSEYHSIKEHLYQKYEHMCGKPYFEFHVKVSNNCLKDFCFNVLENDVVKYNNVAISYNMCSSERKPLLTIRVYNKGFLNAQKYKDMVLDELKELGYMFENKIQQEFSIYDSNSVIDSYWLINEM